MAPIPQHLVSTTNPDAVVRNIAFLAERTSQLSVWEAEFLHEMLEAIQDNRQLSRAQTVKIRSMRVKYSG